MIKRLHILSRIRHFRGHGIHSPFVYGLKREVFMGKCCGVENHMQYNTLTANGVPQKVAKELQKLHNYCNFQGVEIVNGKSVRAGLSENTLYVITDGSQKAVAKQILGTGKRVAIAIVAGGKNKPGHDCVTIWRKRYTVYIKNDGLRPQSYKL